MSEESIKHIHQQDSKERDASILLRKRGQIVGAIIVLVALGLIAWLGYLMAIIPASILGAVVGIFSLIALAGLKKR